MEKKHNIPIANDRVDLLTVLQRVASFNQQLNKNQVSIIEYSIKEVFTKFGIDWGVPIEIGYGFFVKLNMTGDPRSLSGKATNQRGGQTDLPQIEWLMKHGGCITAKIYFGADMLSIGRILFTFGVNGVVTFIQLTGNNSTLETVAARLGCFSRTVTGGLHGIIGNFLLQLVFGRLGKLTKIYSWSDLKNAVDRIKADLAAYQRIIDARSKGVVNAVAQRVIVAGASSVGDAVENVTFGMVSSGTVQNSIYNKGKKK